jgi:phage minor structural protein, N-terminal domain protein|nr:MAG TPA: tail protein [Bacteriophage sp.]
MLLTIHDSKLRPVASIDNEKQKTLNYFDDTWTQFFETGASTFDFTVSKKALMSDSYSQRAYNLLSEKNFISFEYDGETHLFIVRKTIENEAVIKANCVNLNLELINEYSNPFKAQKAMTFEEYCKALDLLNFTLLQIGVNEVSDKRITAEWEGTDTKLARLLSLANKFGAELEFKTYLNDDSSIKRFVVNVYHENDAEHQGVGKVQSKVLRYGRDFRSLTRTVDTTGIYNATRPTGKGENGSEVTIAGMKPLEIKNDKGEVEFYQSGDMLYAPISMRMFPAAFTEDTMKDQWIRKDFPVDSSSQEVIRSSALRELKKNCYPAITYEVDGYLPYGVGDTVEVEDDGFYPTLLLQMRVFEQSRSFTGTGQNKTTFANFKAIENRVSSGLKSRLEQLIEDAKPYSIRLSASDGVTFKNNKGTSIITPMLLKGNKELSDVLWKWQLGNTAVTTGNTYTAIGSLITDAVKLTVMAFVNDREVARDYLSLVNVNDGAKGDPGNVDNIKINGRSLSAAFEEIENKVNSKADGQLTQDQLNKLSERDALINAEMEALATKAIVEQWISEIEKLSDTESKGRKEAEDGIRKASERIIDLQRKVGELQVMTEFVDTYMSQSEEGLVVGRKDGSSKVLVSNDRISFISGGKEVASISQGVLQIDNGVFVKSLRIGRFVTFQDPTNLDRNLTMYVGGV